MSGAAAPADGFRANAAGLYVPDAISRIREVITRAEWKRLESCIQHVLGPRRLRFLFRCDYDGCADPRVSRVPTADGFVLRCGCRDRVYSRGV